MISPTYRREQEMWRVEWVGGDEVGDVEQYANVLGHVGVEISADAITILKRKGFFQ